MKCPSCGSEVGEGAKYCSKCGASIVSGTGFIITTTPTVAGYKIKQVLGVVTGLTRRTRGLLGKFVAGIESMLGGEVSAFTTELEKARIALGANAVGKGSSLVNVDRARILVLAALGDHKPKSEREVLGVGL